MSKVGVWMQFVMWREKSKKALRFQYLWFPPFNIKSELFLTLSHKKTSNMVAQDPKELPITNDSPNLFYVLLSSIMG